MSPGDKAQYLGKPGKELENLSKEKDQAQF